jgi:hypothetical protein
VARTYAGIDDRLRGWIARQPLLFVGDRAPARERAHRRDAVRVRGPPRIVGLHGRGRVVPADGEEFAVLLERAASVVPPAAEALRAVIVVDVTRISGSCGYGVPLMTHAGERPHQDAWAAKKLCTGGPGALAEYQAKKNAVSIDGLPAVG